MEKGMGGGRMHERGETQSWRRTNANAKCKKNASIYAIFLGGQGKARENRSVVEHAKKPRGLENPTPVA